MEIAAERAPLVDFHQGDPDLALVEAVHRGGALAGRRVGTAREAREAQDAGCDIVVAQGLEAAGYSRGRAGTMALLQEVLDAVSVPVLAAGGIGTPRGVAAALAAGAAGVRVGTRFLAAAEAGTDPVYVEALAAARAEDTVMTDRFAPPGCPSALGPFAPPSRSAGRFWPASRPARCAASSPPRRSCASSAREPSDCWPAGEQPGACGVHAADDAGVRHVKITTPQKPLERSRSRLRAT